MGWFTAKPRRRIVSVSFRELTSDTPPNADHAYAYIWELSGAPSVGERVWVRGGDGRKAAAVIAAVNVRPPRGMTLAKVMAKIDPIEVAGARDSAVADETAWLNMARRAAGLPATGRARTKVPTGFPAIAPVDGKGSGEDAAEYGRMWWRVFKAAEERGWPASEVKQLKSIAHRWYAVRDKGGNL